MRLKNWLTAAAILTWWLTGPAEARDAVRWQISLETAQRLALQTNRLVLVHFWAEWCEPCKQMEREVFSRPEVAAALEAGFVPVKLNRDYFPHTAQRYEIAALPTDVIMTPQGQLIGRIVGVADASHYLARLNQVALVARSRIAARDRRASPGLPSASGPERSWTDGPMNVPPNRVDSGLAALPQGQETGSAGGQWPQGGSGPDPRWSSRGGTLPDPGLDQAGMQPSQAFAQMLPAQRRGPAEASSASPAPRYGRDYAARGEQTPPAAADLDRLGASQGPALQAPPPIQMPPAVQVPPGNPPLGLDGYCPVQLAEHERWVPGDPRWGLIHRGRTYLFAGPRERDRFNADPDRYAPALEGNDVVMLVERGQIVPGRREAGAWLKYEREGQPEKRVYLFSSGATRAKFAADPDRYFQAGMPSTPDRIGDPASALGESANRAPWGFGVGSY